MSRSFGPRSSGVLLIAAAILCGGCASTGGAGSALADTELTAEELAQLEYETVYDFLRAHSRARIVNYQGREFLTVYDRGIIRGADEAMLIVNNQEVRGNVGQVIRQMPLSSVQALMILRPSQTGARYGGDGRVGAVVIETTGSP